MSEVSSWSTTDAGNNLTPPDGWPEGMQPSGVNDVGRMMMGAIKRWYDTVTAGIANALPLSGGTLTGTLTGTNINVSGSMSAVGNMTAGGQIHCSYLQSTGDIDAGGNIGAVGNIATNAQIHGGYVESSGHMYAAGNITADGQLLGSLVTSEGDINAGGAANVTGTLTAGDLSAASANIPDITCNTLTANSLVNTFTYRLSGVNFATTRTDAAGTCNAIFDGGGGLGIDLYGVNGSYYRCDNAHSFTNRAATVNIVRFQVTDGVCQNISGSWSTLSDREAKENLAPYTAGLAACLKLNPQSFTYVPGKTKFATGDKTFYGLVAQDVETVLPEMVGRDDDTGAALLQPTHLVFVLLNAVKELEARLAQLENRGG